MKKYYLRLTLSLLSVLMISLTGMSQDNRSLWTKSSKLATAGEALMFRKTQPQKATYYQLNLEGLKSILDEAPRRDNSNFNNSNVVVEFPNAQGELEAFKVMEASIMQPELQAFFSNMRSYVGQSLDNPSKIIRFPLTMTSAIKTTKARRKCSSLVRK